MRAIRGATIRNVLQVTSGVEIDADYLDPDSDINRMGRVVALGGMLDGFTAGLTARAGAPGGLSRTTRDDASFGQMIAQTPTS
jgi:CubicO group peptidase (beta-lactamase class C family)